MPQQANPAALRIGTIGSLPTTGGQANEKSALRTLQGFVKDETDMDNEIVKQKDWQELAKKLSTGELHLGVFPGYLYARAQPKHPDLQPLAVAVNAYVYPVVYVVAKKDNRANDFAGLQGQSLALMDSAPGYLRLYLERQCQLAGKKVESSFSKMTSPDNFEDAFDDVVDAKVDAVVADLAAVEAYKRRKPARFAKLKTVAQSQPFPPAVVACYGDFIDEASRKQLRKGLLDASNKERGQTMLTLFRLTHFQTPPADFDKVLAATRAAYPGEGDQGK
jgi:ABC-type phosphate/phosphonate transport system substrate-binding protein